MEVIQETKQLVKIEDFRKSISCIKGTKDYKYQSDIIIGEFTQKIYNNEPLGNPLLLACVPAAGKTFMASMIAYFYVKNNQNKRVVILTEGKVFLREQFGEDSIKYLITSKLLNENDIEIIENEEQFINTKAKILILIPQTISKLIKDKNFNFKDYNIDLVISDEAHNWRETKNDNGLVQQLLKRIKPINEILLTGSPSSFNGRNFPAYYVPDEDLPNEMKAPMSIQLCKTICNIRCTDYTVGDNLNPDYDWKENELKNFKEDLIDSLVDVVINKLMSEEKNYPDGVNFITSLLKKSKKIIREAFFENYLEKTIIYCHNINQAIYMYNYLKSYKKIDVYLTHSDPERPTGYDEDSAEIKKFRELKEAKAILISVGRAKEAFNDPYLVNEIDMTCSSDPELIKQMIDRAKRPYPNQPNKLKTSIKIVPEGEEFYFEKSLNFAINLGYREIFMNYDGSNINDMVIRFVEDEGQAFISNALNGHPCRAPARGG